MDDHDRSPAYWRGGAQTMAPEESLLCLTREDLRQELSSFTDRVLRQELLDLAAHVQRELCDELRRCLEPRGADASFGSSGLAGNTTLVGASLAPSGDAGNREESRPPAGETPNAWPAAVDGENELRKTAQVNLAQVMKVRGRFVRAKHIRTHKLNNLKKEIGEYDAEIDETQADEASNHRLLPPDSVSNMPDEQGPSDSASSKNRDNEGASDSTDTGAASSQPGRAATPASLRQSRSNSSRSGDRRHSNASPSVEALKASAQRRQAFENKGHTVVFDMNGATRQRLLHNNVAKIVRSPHFDMVVNLVIMLNAVYIGIITHIMADYNMERLPFACGFVEMIFLVAFTVEMGMRFFVHRCGLFMQTLPDGRPNQDIYWSLLDIIVIALQSVELFFRYIDINGQSFTSRVSVIRLLRIVRIVRVVRLLKVFRFVRDLRMIVYSIWRSFSLFFWSVIALFSMTFMWSVYFTEITSNYLVGLKVEGRVTPTDELEIYFGNMARTMLSLVQAVMGGIDWRDLTDTLMHINFYFGVLPLVAYVTFTQLAIMNVITGVFLESAMDRAKKETEIYMVRNARRVFRAADTDHTGKIAWRDFEKALDNEDVNDFFEAIDIDVSEAQTLFDLLDVSGDGAVSADEFLSGCLRVKGQAKALDLLVFSRQMEVLLAGIGDRCDQPCSAGFD